VRPLHGIGVLVTRPAQQAAPLCRLLEAQGASSHRLPAIEIEPIDVRSHARSGVDRSAPGGGDPRRTPDLVIFISANAVRLGLPLLEGHGDVALAAVGPATARALREAGHPVAVLPESGFDSESLLAHPRFKQLGGRRVLLVKGCGGRELLADELARRGALLEIAEVYRRVPARPDGAALQAVEREVAAGTIQVITATSLEIGTNLLALATPVLRAAFDRLHWLVPSERVAAGLSRDGLNAPVLHADSAEDQDLVAALLRWRSSVSGA
jgi:uroporphyrinogen-III synthase